jgi:hypothetical protein
MLSENDLVAQLEAPLDQLNLSTQYQKLIKRISRSFGAVTTVQDILDIDPIEFSQQPAVGKLYVELLVNFQNELVSQKNSEKIKKPTQQITLSVEQLETSLNRLILSPQHEKLIKRISRSMGDIKTVQDVLDIDPIEFSQQPAVGKLYVELLVNFQNELVSQNISEKIKKPTQQITLSVEQLETPLNRLILSPQHEKLIKRISRSFGAVTTVQDILDIDPIEFSQKSAVGKLYVDSLVSFQNEFVVQDVFSHIKIENKEELLPQEILSKLYVNYAFLDSAEIKQLKKLEAIYGEQFDIFNVKNLLNIDKLELSKKTGVGALTLTVLTELQRKIKCELRLLPTNITEHTIKNRSFFISNEVSFIEFSEIDNVLIEDIECYLWTLDEVKMDIALSRWGFNKQHESLEDVGQRHGITRERVRQIEKKINVYLSLNFRIQPKVLWANIRENMIEDLTKLLPNLAQCFTNEKNFYEFIELCCQVESGSISEIVFTKINPKIINSFFCFNQSPIALETIINELMSNYGHSKASAVNGIKQLAKYNTIEVTSDGVYPKKLSREQAVAHVLCFYPSGLPWKDIARIANRKKYSSTPLDEVRITHGFNDSEYVYLCGHGTYRNLMFLDLEQFNTSEIIQKLFYYLKQKRLDAINLHDYYQQSKIERSEIDYFTLRYIVREYGEEYGVFFNGKSSTDSISLNPELKQVTQSDVIIGILQKSSVAMTKQEIAKLLKSKSMNHASFYLDALMKEGKVVRVDKLVYTTPEKAFSKIDIDAVMQIVKDVINFGKIVEADVFREYVNMELNLSYSKYIYAALVRTKLNELGWHRSGTLFCKNLIPYKSLSDMYDQLCNVDLSNSENIQNIKRLVWLTDAVAANALQWWRFKIKSKSADLDTIRNA